MADALGRCGEANRRVDFFSPFLGGGPDRVSLLAGLRHGRTHQRQEEAFGGAVEERKRAGGEVREGSKE